LSAASSEHLGNLGSLFNALNENVWSNCCEELEASRMFSTSVQGNRKFCRDFSLRSHLHPKAKTLLNHAHNQETDVYANRPTKYRMLCFAIIFIPCTPVLSNNATSTVQKSLEHKYIYYLNSPMCFCLFVYLQRYHYNNAGRFSKG
jgi:hypothetical protein